MSQETRSDGSSQLKARVTCAYREITLSHRSGNLRDGHQDHLGPGAGVQGPGVTGRERNLLLSKARGARRRDGEGGAWWPRKLCHMASGSDGGIFAPAAAKRRQVTGHAVRGRTTGASSKPSCPRWAEGLLGGDKGVRQSGAGVECEKAEAGQREAVRVTQATIALRGWLAQGPGSRHARVSSHVRGECPGPASGTANSEAPPGRGAGRRRGARGAELTHLGPGPRTGSASGSGLPAGPARSRAAAAVPGPGLPAAALRPAPCSSSPHRPCPGTDHAPTRPRFYPRARAPPSGAGPTPGRCAAPPATPTVKVRIRGDPQFEALTHFSQ